MIKINQNTPKYPLKKMTSGVRGKFFGRLLRFLENMIFSPYRKRAVFDTLLKNLLIIPIVFVELSKYEPFEILGHARPKVF